MKKSIFLWPTLLTGLVLALSTSRPSVSAPVCTPLKAVGGENGQTTVQKRVSAPRVPIGIGSLKRDNWNTDFVVPSNTQYKRFVATLKPQTDGVYSIKVNLKYSDGTADAVYDEKPTLVNGKPLVVSSPPRAEVQPFQVNVFVGDAESIAKSYKVTVKACR